MEYEVQGPLQTALHISKTVVPVVLARLDFWLFFSLHLVLHVLFKMGYMHQKFARMTISDMGMITAATVFFEVFYTGACFQRYMGLYSLVTGYFSNAYNFVFLTRLHFRPKGKSYDRLAAQWLIGAVVLSLFEARMKRPMQAADLQKLLALGLMRQHEMAFLRTINGFHRSMVMLHLAGDFTRTAFVVSEAPAFAIKDCVALLDDMAAIQQEMHDLISFEMPFGYVHLLSVMITLNMLAWSYAIATQQSSVGPVFYFFCCLIFIGMMDLATALADPFGDDPADFPLQKWTHEFLLNMSALIDYEHDGLTDGFDPDLREEEYQTTEFKLSLRQIEMLMDEQEEETYNLTPRGASSAARNLSVYDMPHR